MYKEWISHLIDRVLKENKDFDIITDIIWMYGQKIKVIGFKDNRAKVVTLTLTNDGRIKVKEK